MNVDSSAIDALFAQWDTPNTPGCVLAVIHEGAIVYQRAYGMADLEREVPLTTESLFDLGSIGKQFVAALIALLAEEGRLSLDDTVQRYVSELPDYGAPITLRHLLHHTSGVRDYLDIMQLSNRPFENHYPAEELLYLLTSQQNLNFAPGERYEYSNGGYFLLGVVAERVMQQPLTALLRQYILEPLGMQRTQGNDNLRRIAKQRALAYVPAAEHGYATELSYLGGFGDGPLLSCVGDLLLWDQNFYDNRLGKADPRLIEQLETVGRLNNGEPIQYALGLMVSEYRGQKMVAHSGGWAGYVSHMLRFPQQHLSVICLANLITMQPAVLSYQVADLYLDQLGIEAAVVEPEAAEQSGLTIQAEQLVGYYSLRTNSLVLQIQQQGDALSIFFLGQHYPLQALSDDTLATPDQLFLVRSPAPDTLAITVHGDTELFERLAVTPLSAELLPQYVGRYHSSELDLPFTLVQQGEQIYLKRGFAEPEAVDICTRELFTVGHNALHFNFAQSGEPSGFTLDSGRLKGIVFRKG